MAHILVIDDESNIRMMLRIALTHVGHAVETAADGYEGLERFGNGDGWDLVILDQRMPGLEGLEVLREMRTRAEQACVLMITAFGTIDLATEAMAAGATNFLRKPFTVETLRGAVSVALGGGRDVGGVPPAPYSFDLATVNGFRLRSMEMKTAKDGGISQEFTVQTAVGAEHTCHVSLPAYVVELVKAHADLDEMPGKGRFWEALCAEALANSLWQNAEVPTNGTLVVDDLTSGLRHFIDAVLSGAVK